MRSEFELPECDRDFLESREKPWEAIVVGKVNWVIIEDFQLPSGYKHATATIALKLENSYPDVQIDMAYFSPHLARSDGKEIKALTDLPLDGKTWQQWSRHRVAADSWRPGVDNIEMHLLYVRAFLESELLK